MIAPSLKDSEAYFRYIIDESPTILWASDKNGQTLFTSQAWERLTGIGVDEMARTDWRSYTHPDDISVIETTMRAAYQNAAPYTFHMRVKGRHGGYVWLSVHASPILDEQGELQGFIGSSTDISDLKQLNESLAASEEWFRSAFEHATVCMAMTDLNGHLIRINPAFTKLLGYSDAEVAGRHFNEITHPDDVMIGLALKEQLIGGRMPTGRAEKRIIDKQGGVLHVAVGVTLVRDGQGTPRHLLASINDVTRLKQLNESLAVSEERFRSAFDYAATGMTMVSLEGNYIRVNQAFCDMLGYTARELLNRHVNDVTHPDGLVEGLQLMRVLKTPGVTNRQLEKRYKHKNGSDVWCLLGATLVRDPVGKPLYYLGQVLNITARKRMEEQLKEINRQLSDELEERKKLEQKLVQTQKLESLGQLTAGIAHEINNPVAYIKSNLNTLKFYRDEFQKSAALAHELEEQVGRDHPKKYRELLDRIREHRRQANFPKILPESTGLIEECQEGVERIADIVGSLKSFARVDNSDMRAADVNQCIKNALRMLENELKYKCSVYEDYGDLPSIRGLPIQLSQVFVNLLINAAEAMDDQGDVFIETVYEKKKSQVTVCIRDTGTGIEGRHLNQIFDPFFTTKPVGRGTGLGLYVSYGIIQRHGGAIEVESTAGEGSTFTVRLPIR